MFRLHKYCRRLLLAFLLLTTARPALAQQAAKVDFAHDIVPIIKARCAECHTNGKSKGSVSFDTRESTLKAKAAVPGNSKTSSLIQRVTSDEITERMPPKGDALTAKQIELLRAWIDQGMAWEPGFSFRTPSYVAPLRLRTPSLPPVSTPELAHPIDRIVFAYFAANHVAAPPVLDDAAFLRRAHLDVIGLLPTAAELRAFLEDKAGDKRQRKIEALLGQKRAYAEHWLTFWNDLLRNDYQGTGYIDGGRKAISAWLYQALLENKPYNQFVRELISPTPASEGFINGIKWRGRINASQTPEIQFSQNVSQVFFGINMKCASCHDSFIDTWKLADAYGLAAVIAEKPLEIYRCDKPTGKMAAAKFLWPELGTLDGTQPRAQRLERLANLVTHKDNGRFARTIVNRLWERLMGRGIVHPVDIMANKPWSEDLLDYLAGYLIEHNYDLKKVVEHIVSSRIYQSQPVVLGAEPAAESYVFRGPGLKLMTAEEFLDAVWMITRTGPAKIKLPVKRPGNDPAAPLERDFIRAALQPSNLLMRSLGRPNREQVVTTRPDMLTTLQALDLANGQPLYDMLNRGALNLLEVHKNPSPDSLIDGLYIEALSRHPDPNELNTARQILGKSVTTESLEDLLWAIFMLPEFQFIH
jgi:mono/diheme cytochrome c family protein